MIDVDDIRVLIADDSVLFSQFLKSVVDQAEGFKVCALAANAFEARDRKTQAGYADT